MCVSAELSSSSGTQGAEDVEGFGNFSGGGRRAQRHGHDMSGKDGACGWDTGTSSGQRALHNLDTGCYAAISFWKSSIVDCELGVSLILICVASV